MAQGAVTRMNTSQVNKVILGALVESRHAAGRLEIADHFGRVGLRMVPDGVLLGQVSDLRAQGLVKGHVHDRSLTLTEHAASAVRDGRLDYILSPELRA